LTLIKFFHPSKPVTSTCDTVRGIDLIHGDGADAVSLGHRALEQEMGNQFTGTINKKINISKIVKGSAFLNSPSDKVFGTIGLNVNPKLGDAPTKLTGQFKFSIQ
jgi:hypothetical protein